MAKEKRVKPQAEKKKRDVKMKKISTKLLRVIIPYIIIAFVVLIGIIAFNGKGLIQNLLYTAVQEKTNTDAGQVNSDLNAIFHYLNAIADQVETVEFESDEEILEFLTPTLNRYDIIPTGCYLGLTDKSYFDPSGWTYDDVTEKDFFKEGLSHDDSYYYYFDEPYFDNDTGNLCATVVRHVKLKDGREGVIAADLFMSASQEYLNNVTVLGTGKSMMLTSSGMVLSYTNPDVCGLNVSEVEDDKLLTNIYAKIDSEDGKIMSVKGNDGTYLVCMSTVKGTDWKVVDYSKITDILGDIIRMVVIVVFFTVIVLITMGISLAALIKRLVRKPVEALTDNIEHISSGDFTVDITGDGNDEIAYMNKTMSKFIDNMRGTISNIQDIAGKLEIDSKRSRDTAQTLSGEATEQSNSMENILSTMDNMSYAVEEVAQNATTLAQTVSDLTTAEENIQASMLELVEKAAAGQKDMSSVSTGMTDIVDSMNEMNQAVQDVDHAAEEITKIVDMINGIATQTNLLSLNASIEAARAGEAGKGFAVVATEIGQLASDSGEATKKIAEIIQDMSARVRVLADKSESNTSMINESADSITNAAEVFLTITQELNAASETLTEMAGKMTSVNEVATNMASVSEEQSASTQEITSTITQLTQSAKNVAESSNTVSNTATEATNAADKLGESIHYFKIKG